LQKEEGEEEGERGRWGEGGRTYRCHHCRIIYDPRYLHPDGHYLLNQNRVEQRSLFLILDNRKAIY
ncbi:MAG TPA: hypothetical protein DCL61_26575, partial [Cyanobacteria bacterium UBA12227]|nr:hypothetical protein [Cyanobacteria bacterium UBA12227]